MTATSVLIIEEVFERYQNYKKLDNKLEQLRMELKNRMIGDEMRRVFHSQGVVAKYIRNRVFEVDQIKLNNLLNDYGLLTKVARFEKMDGISEFENKTTHHLRINSKIEKEEFDFSNLGEMELIKVWKETHEQLKKIEQIINGARKQMELCSELNEKKKLTFSNGSISLVKNKITYNVDAIAENLGIDFIIKNAKTSSEKINEYIESGFITEAEIDSCRKLIDVNLKFVVMNLSDEELIFNILRSKQIESSLQRQAVV